MQKDHSSRVPRFMGSSWHYFFIEHLKNTVLSVSQLSSHGSFSSKPFKTLASSIHHHPHAVSLTAPRLLQNYRRSIPRPLKKKKLLPRVTYENVNILGDIFSFQDIWSVTQWIRNPSSPISSIIIPCCTRSAGVLLNALQSNFSSPE